MGGGGGGSPINWTILGIFFLFPSRDYFNVKVQNGLFLGYAIFCLVISNSLWGTLDMSDMRSG